MDLRAEKAELQRAVADLRRANREESSREGSELTDLLVRKMLELKKTQGELAAVRKELDRAKERLRVAGKKNADSERQITSLHDRANHFKGLYDNSMKKMKSTTQSFEGQVASKDEARESLAEQLKEMSHELRLFEQKLQGCEGRNRDMALKVKKTQKIVHDAEERALEFEAFHIAVPEQLQRLEGEAVAASEGPARVEGSTQTAAASAVDPQEMF